MEGGGEAAKLLVDERLRALLRLWCRPRRHRCRLGAGAIDEYGRTTRRLQARTAADVERAYFWVLLSPIDSVAG